MPVIAKHRHRSPQPCVGRATDDNPNTRRAYENDVREFVALCDIGDPDEFRMVTRLTWLRGVRLTRSGSWHRR